jgi:hypothetical protein
MAKNSITDYSKTAASNTDIQSVDIDEGCLPSGINNAIRELMADLAEMNDGTVTLTSPSFAAATVTGALASGSATVGSTTSSAAVHSYTKLEIESSSHGALQLSGSTGAEQWIWFADDSSSTPVGGITYYHGGPYMAFRVEGSERMRIDASGHVGIGTSSALSDVLTVDDTNPKISMRDSGTERSFFEVDASDNFVINNKSTSAMILETSDTERMRITSDGSVGIGTSSPASKLHIFDGGSSVNNTITFGNPSATPAAEIQHTAGGNEFLNISCKGTTTGFGNIVFKTGATPDERMRVDSSGDVLMGNTVPNPASGFNDQSGFGYDKSAGKVEIASTSGLALSLGRNLSSDGHLAEFRKQSNSVGDIQTHGGKLQIGQGNANLQFSNASDAIIPSNGSGTLNDDALDIGLSNARFDDIYATNGTIQTSDRNEKQDIEALSEAEQRVAVAAKGLLRKFRWKDSVEEKGNDARIHFGIIAQDLQAAFEAEGLDAGRYAMFINSTWTDEETGEERSRMGVRYNQLLAFIIAAI